MFQRMLLGNPPRLRTRNALRPVGERTIGPHVHFGHVADRARLHPLHGLAPVVPRVALVAHLRDGLRRLPRLARQLARFVHRPAQRLLHVDVLAEIERGHRDRRVHVIGRRDDDRVDVLLLLEHQAVVGVALLLRQVLGQRFA